MNLAVHYGAVHHFVTKRVARAEQSQTGRALYLGIEFNINPRNKPFYLSIGTGFGAYTTEISEQYNFLERRDQELHYISLIPRLNYQYAQRFHAGIGAGIAMTSIPGDWFWIPKDGLHYKMPVEAYAGYSLGPVSLGIKSFLFVPGVQTISLQASVPYGNTYSSLCEVIELKIRLGKGDAVMPD